MTLNRLERSELVAILKLGLTTDGAHYKQWCLIELLKRINAVEWERLATTDYIERGIAP